MLPVCRIPLRNSNDSVMRGPDWRRLMTFGAATLGVVAVFFSCVNARSAIAKPDKQVAVVCLDPELLPRTGRAFPAACRRSLR